MEHSFDSLVATIALYASGKLLLTLLLLLLKFSFGSLFRTS